MSSASAVTHWIAQLKVGNHDGAQQLWERYFQRLTGLARKKLQGAPRRAADEEDVALSAFDSFCRGAQEGRFPQLADRQDLWQLLVVIAARKALDLIKHEAAKKRGGGWKQVAMTPPDGTSSLIAVPGIEQVVGPEPTPDFAAQVAEETRRLLDKLSNDELRAVAVWKMEGHTTEEIANLLGCVPRTVERKLSLIRSHWEQEIQS